MKASDLFVKCLEAEGVKTIFGVPGEENADLMMSIKDSGLEFIMCRHEQAAAFMADMHGRLTGQPGVCLSTLGPGATNLLTGVASANMDHSPLVAIIGQASSKRIHKESHQMMDSVSMFQPVTKWATTVRDADNIPELVRKAFKIATLEKAGATVIELPEDIAKENSEQPPIPPYYSKPHAGVEPHQIADILNEVERAETPLLLIGNGCVRGWASEAVVKFIEETGMYATNTFMGKGILPATNEHSLYCVGLGLKDIALEAFERADLVICAGYDLVEWPPEKWNIGKKKRIVHIDTQPAEVDKFYRVDLDIIGDIAETFEAINEGLGPQHKKSLPMFAEVRGRITKDLEEFDNDDAFPMKPQRILSDVREVMEGRDILISDVGAHKLWVARHYTTYLPNTCIITNGFCSMGFALPGAIAAKKQFPEVNVVALCGDGGFMMNVQDLITAVRYKIPIVVLIWDDNGFGLIRWKQGLQFCRHAYTDLVNPDFVKLAESFDCLGLRVESAAELKPALLRAFAEKSRPTVITVAVDYEENINLMRKTGDLTCPPDAML